MNSKKRILVAPLDWGLGHASRCVAIIRQLQQHNFEVLVGSYGRSEQLLKEEFPTIQFIALDGIQIRYPKKISLSISIFFQIPKIVYSIFKEYKNLQKTIEEYKIEGVISDNRFGMWSSKIPSIFITHQLEIQSKFLKNIIRKINFFFINKYTECWVPDFEDNYLAGDLSENKIQKKNIKYIGALSRFEREKTEKKYDLCFAISGPEPQRTLFEEIIMEKMKDRIEKSIIILGKPEEKEIKTIANCEIYPHLNSEKLNTVFLQSNLIFCRSGYSTIMDLYKVNKKAVFIPTPGQTEQEYLSRYFNEKKIFLSQNQNEFDLNNAIIESKKYSGFTKSEKGETNWEELLSIF